MADCSVAKLERSRAEPRVVTMVLQQAAVTAVPRADCLVGSWALILVGRSAVHLVLLRAVLLVRCWAASRAARKVVWKADPTDALTAGCWGGRLEP